MIFTAFPRPLSISRPEWPPRRPVTRSSSATMFALAASRTTVQVPRVSWPPAQPT